MWNTNCEQFPDISKPFSKGACMVVCGPYDIYDTFNQAVEFSE